MLDLALVTVAEGLSQTVVACVAPPAAAAAFVAVVAAAAAVVVLLWLLPLLLGRLLLLLLPCAAAAKTCINACVQIGKCIDTTAVSVTAAVAPCHVHVPACLTSKACGDKCIPTVIPHVVEPAGGLFWFTDLCEPALNLAAVSAPLGSIGVALPAGVALAMFANIQRSFGATPSPQGGQSEV